MGSVSKAGSYFGKPRLLYIYTKNYTEWNFFKRSPTVHKRVCTRNLLFLPPPIVNTILQYLNNLVNVVESSTTKSYRKVPDIHKTL